MLAFPLGYQGYPMPVLDSLPLGIHFNRKGNGGGGTIKATTPLRCPQIVNPKTASRFSEAGYFSGRYFFGRTVSFIDLPTRNFSVVLAGI